MRPETLCWHDDCLRLIDQTKLPEKLVYLDCRTAEDVRGAIERLSVRGAPAIGVAAGFGIVVAALESKATTLSGLVADLDKAADYLASSRPTAVNLFWAIDRMRKVWRGSEVPDNPKALLEKLLALAKTIHEEDKVLCEAIGRYGAELLPDPAVCVTHCNAGALATGGQGTALSVFYSAAAAGKKVKVYVDETRPLLQGARLTAWELQQAGVEVIVQCDNAAGSLFQSERIDAVVTGADRIAGNGDVANKIGTYPLAVLANHHGVPFYIAAPYSTFDLKLAGGREIPIEERNRDEVACGFGRNTIPDGVAVRNPAFDITPAALISAIITDKGVLRAPYAESIAAAALHKA